jgi:hypothetical protein
MRLQVEVQKKWDIAYHLDFLDATKSIISMEFWHMFACHRVVIDD